MKCYDHLRAKAKELYAQGLTLPEIAEHLNKSKGTVHYWLKDVPKRGTSEKVKLSAMRASKVNKAKAEARRVVYREAAQELVPRLSDDPCFRDFVMLYLTEGTRKSRGGCVVAVANSNPKILKLATKFIRDLVKKEPTFCLQYHVDQDPHALAEFWATIVETTPDKITLQRKSNSGLLAGRSWASRYGVLTVRTGSVEVRTMLGVWMDALQDLW